MWSHVFFGTQCISLYHRQTRDITFFILSDFTVADRNSAHSTTEFPTLPIVCCCTTLKKCNSIRFFTTTVKLICNACGNFIVVTNQAILVISLTGFFADASRRHTAASDTQCLVTTLFQQDNAPAHRAAYAQLLRQKTPNFLVSNLWPPILSPVDYKILAVMQHRVYHRQIQSG